MPLLCTLPKVLDAMQKAGWYSGRNMGLDVRIESLSSYGLQLPPPAVVKFFSEFDCLEIRGERNFDLNVMGAIERMEGEERLHLNRIFDKPIWPFGYGERVFFIVDENLKVLLLHDEWIGYTLKPSFDIALNLLYDNKIPLDYVYLTEDQKPPMYR